MLGDWQPYSYPSGKNWQSILAEVQNVDLLDYIRADLGVPGQRRGRYVFFRCPFHAETEPSFAVNPERNTFRCYGSCSMSGDILDYVQHRRGIADVREAGVIIVTGGVLPAYTPPPPRQINQDVFTMDAVNERAADIGAGLPYLKQRGLTRETASHFHLGVERKDWRYHFLDGSDYTFRRQYLTIPNLLRGKVRGMKLRRDEAYSRNAYEIEGEAIELLRQDMLKRNQKADSNASYQAAYGFKFMQWEGSQASAIFNADELLEAYPIEHCIVSEHEIDTMLLWQLGYIAVSTTVNHITDYQQAFQNVLNLVIIADNDGGAGLNKAVQIRELAGKGRIILPEMKDANDWYIAQGETPIRKWLSTFHVHPVRYS